MEKIYPETVFTDEKGYKSVHYSRLTAVLAEAIRELNTKNEAQQKTTDELKSQNKELKTNSELRISKIEAAMEKLLQSTIKEGAKNRIRVLCFKLKRVSAQSG